MEAEILANVISYLKNMDDEISGADSPVLLILLRRAIRRVCAKRYPWGYDEAQKSQAIEKYRDIIFDATIYYWVKRGAEGQASHNENGIGRSYQNEDDIYFDIVPMTKIV